MISDKKAVQDFLRLLSVHGIEHVIITPGSRNAPFSLSLVNHPTIAAHSIVDERSAGFVALGMAQQLAKQVVLICTSGTAALNFAPAIAEAYYQRVPLLVVTADRPMEWIDQGEGQSIRQRDMYRNYVKASYEIAEEASDGDLVWYNVRIMDEAMRLCIEGVSGPVHINFPLRENLYGTVQSGSAEVKTILRSPTVLSIAVGEWEYIKKKLKESNKVMVLAGQMLPDESLLRSLSSFSNRRNVAVLTEAHSNLADDAFISTIDRLIMSGDDDLKKSLVPDLLITIGHNIISRKIKDLIRNENVEHWHIDVSGEGLDTFKHLSKIIPLSPVSFFGSVDGLQSEVDLNTTSHYRENINNWNESSRHAGDHFTGVAPWSDLKCFHLIHAAIPSGSDLQMGNSSVVRYILLSDARKDLHYFGNRGVAGIDGCTSTAVGASFVSGKMTTLISGDIGFFYDSNAFWNEMVVPRLKIIVINNGGGGIFRIIDGPQSTGVAMEKFFETTHQRKADKLAAMYNIPYHLATNEETLHAGIQWLYKNNECAILEVTTPRLENDLILKRFFKTIRENA